jgi:hypothetical protein
MKNFILFFQALRAGELLADPATWKSRQLSVTAILAILYFLVKVLPMDIPSNDLTTIADGIALVGGLVNSYLTVATTEKVGVPDITDRLKNAALWVKDWRFVSAAFIVSAVIYWSLS